MANRTTTGNKDNGTISAASPNSGINVVSPGGLTLVRAAGTFTAADFNDARIVALYDSTASTYKGVAWARAYGDANEIELESEFLDKDGNTVTPVAGDVWELSKNWADVDADDATGEITWDAATRTVTITGGACAQFGVAGDPNGVCFYDEDVFIRTGDLTINDPFLIGVSGGLFVHGHLLDYANRSFYGPVSVHSSNNSAGLAPNGDQISIRDGEAKLWWMGGTLTFDVTPARLPGGSNTNTHQPALWQKWWGVSTNGDFVTPGGGADWTARAADQHFADLVHTPDSNNAIASRLADSGLVTGQTFKGFPGTPIISMFGSDSGGTKNIGSSPGERTLIRDQGGDSETSLWRSSSNTTQTINATNVISANRIATIGTGGGIQTGATINFFFSDVFSNVQPGSSYRVEEDGNNSLEDSGSNVSGNVPVTVREAQVTTGNIETVDESTWNWQFANYNHNPVFGSFSTTTVATLSGSAKDVPFNTFLNQLTDAAITQPDSTLVSAYTGIVNGEQLYDRTKLYSVSNLGFPDIFSQVCEANGSELQFGNVGVTLNASAGTPFSVNQSGNGEITIKTNQDPVIQRVGQSESVSSGESDQITISFPPGIQDNDVAYIAIGHAQSEQNTWNTPSGWVIPVGLAEVTTGGAPASTPGVSVFRRVLSGDSGSITITNAGTNTSGIVAQMIVYRGLDTSNPEDATPTTAAAASGDPDPAAITTANDDAMVLTFGFQDHGVQLSTTPPAGYTAILETQTPDGAGTGEA